MDIYSRFHNKHSILPLQEACRKMMEVAGHINSSFHKPVYNYLICIYPSHSVPMLYVYSCCVIVPRVTVCPPTGKEASPHTQCHCQDQEQGGRRYITLSQSAVEYILTSYYIIMLIPPPSLTHTRRSTEEAYNDSRESRIQTTVIPSPCEEECVGGACRHGLQGPRAPQKLQEV